MGIYQGAYDERHAGHLSTHPHVQVPTPRYKKPDLSFLYTEIYLVDSKIVSVSLMKFRWVQKVSRV